MKKPKRSALAIGTAACMFAAVAQAGYTYTVGPNYVNMSGSRCRALSGVSEQSLNHFDGRSTAASGAGGVSVMCPLNRRSTSTYNIQTGGYKLTATAMTMKASDSSTTGASTTCTPFATNTDGSITYGTAKYVCSTAGGCTSQPAASFTGTNTLTWTNPLPGQLVTYNWGLYCTLAPVSSAYYYEATITPN